MKGRVLMKDTKHWTNATWFQCRRQTADGLFPEEVRGRLQRVSEPALGSHSALDRWLEGKACLPPGPGGRVLGLGRIQRLEFSRKLDVLETSGLGGVRTGAVV